MHHDPPIFEIKDFLTTAECQELTTLFKTQDGTEAGTKTLSGNGGVRTSTTRFQSYDKCATLLLRFELLLGLLPGHGTFEEPQVVRYQGGERFSNHLDSIQPSLQDSSGNRVATLIVYLNTLPAGSGGETCFPYLDLTVAPKRGTALVFFPSFKTGLVDDRMLHAGLPPASGNEKFIAQVWARQREYQPKMRQDLMQRQRDEKEGDGQVGREGGAQ